MKKLYTYIMNKFKNSDAIVEVTKNHCADIIGDFENNNKPIELTDAEKKSTVDVEIHKEEIKEYVKYLKMMKTNLKKLYSSVYSKCTESVQAMLKVDAEHEKNQEILITDEFLVKAIP